MRRLLTTSVLVSVLAACAGLVYAHGSDSANGISRTIVMSEMLGNIPGHTLTAARVAVKPKASARAHRHEAFVFVFMLRGRIQSQLDDGDVIEYGPGDSWVESPGALHSVTVNPSESETAEFLAVFVAKDGATLTTSGDWSQ